MLLVGHGSKLQYNKELITETGRMIQERSDEYVVRCGFMSINEPSVPNQLDAFRHEAIDALVVVPLFLARGIHIEKDIPALLGLAEGKKVGTFATDGGTVPLVYADPIGVDPLLADLMLKNAQAALSLV
jgi:sirohydrochlorin cobaltochelatase